MYMITYLLPAILFVQFVIFAGVLLFCMHEWDIRTKSGIYLFISYVMALFTLAGIFVVVYFPFPIQQEEIALNIEYELGQTNNFVPFRSIFGYIKDFFLRISKCIFISMYRKYIVVCSIWFFYCDFKLETET